MKNLEIYSSKTSLIIFFNFLNLAYKNQNQTNVNADDNFYYPHLYHLEIQFKQNE